MTLHFIEDDLELPWEYVAVLEADFILWAESKMDAVSDSKDLDSQSDLDHQS